MPTTNQITSPLERLDPLRTFGHMTLIAVLGEGGASTVYLASGVKKASNALYAVKILRSSLADRDYLTHFKDEAKLALRLRHKNIVEVHEAGDLDRQPFIAMSLVEGRDVADIWDRCVAVGKAFPVPVAVFIIQEVLRGLHYAHTFSGFGLIHRDVSPTNILVDWSGAVRLSDFGLPTSSLIHSLTVNSNALFGMSYMSPEQIRHEILDERSDIYACGVVLMELLTGRPFRVDGLVTTAPPPSAHSNRVDAELDAIVVKALAIDREHRYRTAYEFSNALEVWLDHRARATNRGTELLADFMAMLFGDAKILEQKNREELLLSLHTSRPVSPSRLIKEKTLSRRPDPDFTPTTPAQDSTIDTENPLLIEIIEPNSTDIMTPDDTAALSVVDMATLPLEVVHAGSTSTFPLRSGPLFMLGGLMLPARLVQTLGWSTLILAMMLPSLAWSLGWVRGVIFPVPASASR